MLEVLVVRLSIGAALHSASAGAILGFVESQLALVDLIELLNLILIVSHDRLLHFSSRN